jgi:superfamily II DNA or RNA helicase
MSLIVIQPQGKTLTPREYQVNLFNKILDKIEKNKSVVATLPTGGGKTLIMMLLCQKFIADSKRVLIVVESLELVKQVGKKLTEIGLNNFTIIQGSKKPDLNAPIAIASIQTLKRRDYKLAELYDICIIDECHHSIADSYDCLFKAFPPGHIVGFTATIEVNGKYPKMHLRAGKLKRLRHRFDDVVWEIHPKDLVELGYLVKPEVLTYTIAKPKRDKMRTDDFTGDFVLSDALREFDCVEINELLLDEWRKVSKNKLNHDGSLLSAFGFCCSQKHAKNMATFFNSKGIPSAYITANTKDDERKKIFDDFEQEKTKLICSINVISEGFDMPKAEVALCGAPTQSKLKMIQQIGRILRPYSGKDKAYIIDVADNVTSLGHHPLDALNINTIWKEDDEPKPKILPGKIKEEEDEKEKREAKARQVVMLEFLANQQDFETRTIERLTKKRNSTVGSANEYKKYWVYVSFVKTCFYPSQASFKEIGKRLGYNPTWATYAYRKAIAYNRLMGGQSDWDKDLRDDKERVEVKSWAKSYQSSQSYQSSYQSKHSTSSGAKQTEPEININPRGDNFYPQLLAAYKNGWDAVKALYRKLATKLHPDLNPDVPQIKMKNLNLAFEKLAKEKGKY